MDLKDGLEEYKRRAAAVKEGEAAEQERIKAIIKRADTVAKKSAHMRPEEKARRKQAIENSLENGGGVPVIIDPKIEKWQKGVVKRLEKKLKEKTDNASQGR